MKILIDYWYVIFAILALLAIAADAFLTKFPWLAPVITFEQFSGLVDDALEEMRKLLEDNKAVQQLVTGEE